MTNQPGVQRGETFSQNTCKIWRKFEECATIGCQHLLRAELPMYTRNYVQEGGDIQLGKSDRPAPEGETSEVAS